MFPTLCCLCHLCSLLWLLPLVATASVYKEGVAKTPGALFFPLTKRKGPIRENDLLRRRRLLDIGGKDDVYALELGGHFVTELAEIDYYYAIMHIGTPPQRAELVIDTGSTLTYLACAGTCIKCGRHDDPRFEPDKSSTFKWMSCDKNYCNRNLFRAISCHSNPPGGGEGRCSFSQNYLDSSSSDGDLFHDVIRVIQNGEDKEIPIISGCSMHEGGVIYSQNADGVMGMGMDNISIMEQLSKQTAAPMDFYFAHCFGKSRPASGLLALGRFDPPKGTQWTPLLMAQGGGVSAQAPQWYRVETLEIRINDKVVPEQNRVFMNNRFGGTVFDSGSTDFWLPPAIYDSVRNTVVSEIGMKVVKHDYQFATCFQIAFAKALTSFPKIYMDLRGGVTFSFRPLNYLVPKAGGLTCLGIFRGSKGEGIALGSTAMIDKLIIHDKENKKLGFVDVDCLEYQKQFLGDLGQPPGSAPVTQLKAPQKKDGSPQTTPSNPLPTRPPTSSPMDGPPLIPDPGVKREQTDGEASRSLQEQTLLTTNQLQGLSSSSSGGLEARLGVVLSVGGLLTLGFVYNSRRRRRRL